MLYTSYFIFVRYQIRTIFQEFKCSRIFQYAVQYEAYNVTNSNTDPWVFFTFINCTNETKSRKATHFYF